MIERIFFEGKHDNATYYLIIYDVSDDKRRRKISKILESYGVRVQFSAFEMWLTSRKYRELVNKLEHFAISSDNIRIYPLNRELMSRNDNEIRHIIQCDVVIV